MSEYTSQQAYIDNELRSLSAIDFFLYDIENKFNELSFYKKNTKMLHRLQGKPAFIGHFLKYYENGKLHRLDGPAWEDREKTENGNIYVICGVHLAEARWEEKRKRLLN